MIQQEKIVLKKLSNVELIKEYNEITERHSLARSTLSYKNRTAIEFEILRRMRKNPTA